MLILGSGALYSALAFVLLSIACLILATRSLKKQDTLSKRTQKEDSNKLPLLQSIGFIGVWASALALTLGCLVIIIGLLGNDNSIAYVVSHRSNAQSDLALLYKISGLWAGREGSLLFWAWLIALFNSLVALKAWKRASRAVALASRDDENACNATTRTAALDCVALVVAQLVLLVFVFMLCFDDTSKPFVALAPHFLDAAGNLIGAAGSWSMNALLEHWAMAIHPPTLFIGYAGMTIPFAYAVAALVVDDSSKTWVERASRYALVSWLFLGAGIGLGAIWAYVVLGWGGYWGWDPVENASLLSWVIGVGLIHSMTLYKQRGIFKRWTIMLACLTFAFVILGTFITRSGIVQSVHAFSENQVSLVFFGLLIIVPLMAGAVGLVLRRKSFADAVDGSDEAENIMSKDVAYYLNNVIMIVCTVFLAYMTISSSLPSWMPFGGQALGASAYNAIARPIGVIYCLVIALCPLLAWKKTRLKSFLRQAWLPAVFALLLFIVLCVYFVRSLLPLYMQTLALGGSAALTLQEAGPVWYYFALTLLGFLAASLLVFNSLFMLIRSIARRNTRVQTIGGSISHLAMGVLVIGLIGSSMYSLERTGYMEYDEASDTAAESFAIRDYRLNYVSNNIEASANGDDVFYSLTFDLEKDGEFLGQVSPMVQLVKSTNQQQLHAAVMSLPTEDLFVVYRGTNDEGAFSLDVRVNPLISFVWLGFGLLMVGTAIAALGRRKKP